MRITLFGKNSENIEGLVRSFGFRIVSSNPDLIITYGGDGTLLASERHFPKVPKLPIRDSKVCIKCSEHTDEVLLKLLTHKKIRPEKFPKLEATSGNTAMQALNDIVLRNSSQIHALRFNVFKNTQLLDPIVVVGDGIVASTPFGSTGYFKSVTKETFKEGFFLAFNNTIEDIRPLEFKKDDSIRITIVRGPGTLSVDNNPNFISIKNGNSIQIRVSGDFSLIYQPEILRCNVCIIKKDKRLN